MSQFAHKSELFGAGDQSWIGSRHGVEVPKTVTLKPTDWAGRLTADGVLRSGEPYKVSGDFVVPYAGSGTLAGFVLTDQQIRADGGNATVPGLWHGRILLSRLPDGHGVVAGATQTGQFLLEV